MGNYETPKLEKLLGRGSQIQKVFFSQQQQAEGTHTLWSWRKMDFFPLWCHGLYSQEQVGTTCSSTGAWSLAHYESKSFLKKHFDFQALVFSSILVVIIIQNKYIHQRRHSLRKNANKFIRVPEKPMKKCTGFTYCGAKLFNSLPNDIRETQDINTFKMNDWIWKEIPSY